MKKQIIATAVFAALSAPALAQVTVYGGLDMGIRQFKATGSTATVASSANSMYTSRIGFQGSEDLGGGLKAGFILEGGLGGSSAVTGAAGPASGTVGGFTGTNVTAAQAAAGFTVAYAPAGSTQLFNREASLSLSGAFGEIRVGRTDLSGAEGVDTFVGNANFGNLTFIPGSTTNIRTGGVAGELGGDTPDAVRYISPVINGVQFMLGRGLNSNMNSVGKPATGTTNSASVQYVAGPLGIIVGNEATDQGANRDDKYTAFGIRYDFGMINVGLMKADRQYTAGGEDTKWTVASASVPMGNGVTARVSFRKADVAGTANDVDNVNIGLSKALSKRTSINGIYSSNDHNTAANDFKEYTVSVIHTF
jgi:predicted porin